MKIFSVDPGFDRCGVAVVEKGSQPVVLFSTCIETEKSVPYEKRLATLYRSLESLLLEWSPDAIALETLFFSVNKKTALRVAEARGMVVLLSGIHNLSLIELSPQQVKVSMTGVGNAKKADIEKMVSLTLPIDVSKKRDDEIDAIALGVAALYVPTVENPLKRLAKKK